MTRLAVVLIVVLGCNKSSEIDVGAINALVPANHRYKLEFQVRTIALPGKHGLVFELAVPKGWRNNNGELVPNKDIFGPGTSTSISSSCTPEGKTAPDHLADDWLPCTAQNWEEIVDRKIASDYLQVIRNDKEPRRRTIVYTGGISNPDDLGIAVMWWTDGAKEYFTCSAALAALARDDLPAFEQACRSAVVRAD